MKEPRDEPLSKQQLDEIAEELWRVLDRHGIATETDWDWIELRKIARESAIRAYAGGR